MTRAGVRSRVAADLTVVLESPGSGTVHVRLTGSESRLVLEVDRPEVFSGNEDAALVRRIAESLADRDVTLSVTKDGRPLVTMGAVRSPWWQRWATGSPYIRVENLRGAWTSLRSRVADPAGVLPDPAALPPATMLPLVPTFTPRRRPTGTIAPGTGSPQLTLVAPHAAPGLPDSFALTGSVTTLGSDEGCDVVLPGCEPLHAAIVRSPDDELMILPRSTRQPTRLHGESIQSPRPLRTGARIGLGPHVLVYSRAEYADHGRPYGGRSGGEVGRQRPQPR